MSIRLFSDGMPVQSTMLLTDGQFKIAGQLMAMSIVQGGPAPNFLTSCARELLSLLVSCCKSACSDSLSRIVLTKSVRCWIALNLVSWFSHVDFAYLLAWRQRLDELN